MGVLKGGGVEDEVRMFSAAAGLRGLATRVTQQRLVTATAHARLLARSGMTQGIAHNGTQRYQLLDTKQIIIVQCVHRGRRHKAPEPFGGGGGPVVLGRLGLGLGLV